MKFKLLILTFLLIPLMVNANEYHVQICDVSLHRVKKVLGFKEISKSHTLTTYFDTPTQDYYNQGAIIRLRIKKKKVDLTIKLRSPFDFNNLKPRWINDPRIKCEQDHYGDKIKTSCALKRSIERRYFDETLQGWELVESIITQDQIDFFNDHVIPDPDFCALKPYGPILALKYKTKFDDYKMKSIDYPYFYDNEMINEHAYMNKKEPRPVTWKLEYRHFDTLDIIELSFRDTSKDFEKNKRLLLNKLRSFALPVCIVQQSKTKQTIEAFK